MELPVPEFSLGLSSCLGLSVDSSSDCKILKIQGNEYGDQKVPGEIFSLKNNSWRKIGKHPRVTLNKVSTVDSLAFIHGAFHWIVIVQENVNRAANIGQEIEYNHPLFLSPSDVSENQIISFQLIGGIMYTATAKAVWQDLQERFTKVDGSRTFNLHKEIATLTQGVNSVTVYFSKLKTLWEEFEALVPPPGCNCERSKEFIVHLQKLKLFQFLMGLNDSYNQARS
uniref:Uncharacterized protein n=1 Tax=Solanum lycopersicum TaxID=4081 RepID=A0A3Q7I744_SOLLC